jgi:dephospho-CoA kinase
MSKIIGLTGGIGSGKTTIANYFKSKGIPIYIADEEAKKLYLNLEVVGKLIELFGDKILTNYLLDKKKLAEIVFNNPVELEKLNNLIHPLVKKDFELWVANHQNYPILIKESALLFETNNDKNCDFTITVTAPKELKISRVMARDKCSRTEVLKRMKTQLSDKEKVAKSDFVIKNDTIENAKLQADSIIKTIENFTKKQ